MEEPRNQAPHEYVPPENYARIWGRISEGFELIDSEPDRVCFVHPGFTEPLEIVLRVRDQYMFVFDHETLHEVHDGPPETDPDLVGTIVYRRPHRYPQSTWQADAQLTRWLGGYYRRPRYKGYSIDPDDPGGAGFIVRNFWPLETHEAPLTHAVFRLIYAKTWWQRRYR